MHWARAHGVTLDAWGREVHPAITRARLRSLARHTGTVHDGLFSLEVHRAFGEYDPIEGMTGIAKREAARVARHAYLGRYWGITPRELERMTARQLQGYTDALSAIIVRENGPAPTPKA